MLAEPENARKKYGKRPMTERHRLKPMQENYDKETFDRMILKLHQDSDLELVRLLSMEH